MYGNILAVDYQSHGLDFPRSWRLDLEGFTCSEINVW